MTIEQAEKMLREFGVFQKDVGVSLDLLEDKIDGLNSQLNELAEQLEDVIGRFEDELRSSVYREDV